MNYSEHFTKVSVLGAAGKMGSGILLLTAMEMADQILNGQSRDKELWAIDLSPQGLRSLRDYLRSQVLKGAEKKIVWLRKAYTGRLDLVENGEIITAYVEFVLSLVNTSTHLSDAFGSSLVFEAIKEDPAVKVPVLKEILKHSEGKTWFFTNTSSIPISRLNDEAGLDGAIIGFHFYNPPAVQKLVELIPSQKTRDELIVFAKEYARNLRKVVVESNDFAGFIGNGHFMRDALWAFESVERMSTLMPPEQAIWILNRISQEFLLRPMGIFQLVDYVGLDVAMYIMEVMNPTLPDENLHSPLLCRLVEKEIRGGQFSDGSQKEGFFRYEKGKPVAILNLQTLTYDQIDPVHQATAERIGNLPQPLTWKEVNFAADKAARLINFFSALRNMDSYGAVLARAFGSHSEQVGRMLVATGVARTEEDVNTVMQTGFYHAYGPINEFFK